MSAGALKSLMLAELVDDAIGGLWGSPPDSDKPDETDVVVVRGADFRDWTSRRALNAAPRRIPVRSLERRRLQPGDLVLEVSGGSPAQPVGRVLVIDERAISETSRPLICSNFCRKLRLKPGVDPFFVKRQLEWLYRSGRTDRFQTSTTNIRNLQVENFLHGTEIVLPEPELQARLAALLDAIEDKRASSASHVGAAQRALGRFRQAVLAAACSGRLTADWRASTVHSASAEILLQHIHRVRSALPREGKLPKPKPPAGRFPLDVPDEWALSSLDALTIRITSGSRDWSRYYGRGTGTFVMAQNVRAGRLDWSYRQAVDPPLDDQSRSRSQIEVGDLLATIVGANTGDAGPVMSPQPEHYVCQSVALIRPVDPAFTPFLNLWFGSPGHGRGYFDSCLYGAGRPHLSFDQLRSAPVATPSAAEQEEIVRCVEELYSLADTLEIRLDAARTRVDRTSYAVLTKAFRGDLATGPSDSVGPPSP